MKFSCLSGFIWLCQISRVSRMIIHSILKRCWKNASSYGSIQFDERVAEISGAHVAARCLELNGVQIGEHRCAWCLADYSQTTWVFQNQWNSLEPIFRHSLVRILVASLLHHSVSESWSGLSIAWVCIQLVFSFLAIEAFSIRNVCDGTFRWNVCRLHWPFLLLQSNMFHLSLNRSRTSNILIQNSRFHVSHVT